MTWIGTGSDPIWAVRPHNALLELAGNDVDWSQRHRIWLAAPAVAPLPRLLVPEVGMMLRGTGRDGQPFRAHIQQIAGDDVTLDLNHPLAGKTLEFKVKVVEVSKAL